MGKAVKGLLRLGNKPNELLFGKKTARSIDLGGQLFGAYNSDYKPEDVTPPPSPIDATTDAFTARDRVRRTARRALGRDSTIRTSPTGAPYTGAPATLLGG
jgi:hypothetical protein